MTLVYIVKPDGEFHSASETYADEQIILLMQQGYVAFSYRTSMEMFSKKNISCWYRGMLTMDCGDMFWHRTYADPPKVVLLAYELGDNRV